MKMKKGILLLGCMALTMGIGSVHSDCYEVDEDDICLYGDKEGTMCCEWEEFPTDEYY